MLSSISSPRAARRAVLEIAIVLNFGVIMGVAPPSQYGGRVLAGVAATSPAPPRLPPRPAVAGVSRLVVSVRPRVRFLEEVRVTVSV